MNLKTPLTAAIALAIGLAVAAPASAGASTEKKERIETKLTGEAVVPGPGDADAKGKFRAEVDEDEFCYRLSAKKLDGATAAHIHASDGTSVGAVVVVLETPTKKKVSDCLVAVSDADDTEATLSESEFAALMTAPEGFVVDVHSEEFPLGAVQGQLRLK